jgi:Ca2+-transporting ATPase
MTNRALVGAVLLSALLQAGILLSAWGQEIFKVVPLRADEWWLMLGLGVLPFVVMELWKAWRRMREPAAEAR